MMNISSSNSGSVGRLSWGERRLCTLLNVGEKSRKNSTRAGTGGVGGKDLL